VVKGWVVRYGRPNPESTARQFDAIQEQGHRRSRDDGGELLQEFDGLEEQVRRPIAPRRLELDEDASIGAEAEAILGARGAERIATELLEPGATVGGT
jgi:hypothetical protein